MIEIELEKTYLVKKLPPKLEGFPHREIIDIYIPENAMHPVLRLRKKGDVYEMTKKQPIKDGDSSEQTEHTIQLTAEEFEALRAVKNRKSRKFRYDYLWNGIKGEVDVYKDDLEGLVLVDFEFKDTKTKNAFSMPDFCLADVTQEEIFAGGMLCGKKYADVEGRLRRLGYKRI